MAENLKLRRSLEDVSIESSMKDKDIREVNRSTTMLLAKL
jgi:hypothetical protein